MTIGFWAFPMVYVAEMLPDALQIALPFNPTYPALQASRQLIVEGRLPDAWLLPTAFGWGVLASILGSIVLKAVRAELRDVI